MSDDIQIASVLFKPIKALMDYLDGLDVSSFDEDAKKRVTTMKSNLRQSDELVKSQGTSLLQIRKMLKNKNLSSEPELNFVSSLFPLQDIDDDWALITSFAEKLENIRIKHGGDVAQELDLDALNLDEIDRIVEERNRLTDEYRLLIADLSRRLMLITPGEYTKRLEISRQSILLDIIEREVNAQKVVDLGKPIGEESFDTCNHLEHAENDFTPIPIPPPPDDNDLQTITHEQESIVSSESHPDQVGIGTAPSSENQPNKSAEYQCQETITTNLEEVKTSDSSIGVMLEHSRNDKCADVVFVIDASGSMKDCFDQLRTNIRNFVEPFREEGFDSLRLGLLAYSANIDHTSKKCIYRNIVIGSEGAVAMKSLYGQIPLREELFFTRSTNGAVDTDMFVRRLDGVRCKGDEDTVFALDCAADFPYGPLESTRRVMVLFTDEKIEDGVLKQESIGEGFSKVEKVMKKIVDRHIVLYVFAPASPVTDMMSEFSRVYFKNVPEFRPEVTDIWANINFAHVLEMMGKQVSSSLSGGNEQNFGRAVFGQDLWEDDRWA